MTPMFIEKGMCMKKQVKNIVLIIAYAAAMVVVTAVVWHFAWQWASSEMIGRTGRDDFFYLKDDVIWYVPDVNKRNPESIEITEIKGYREGTEAPFQIVGDDFYFFRDMDADEESGMLCRIHIPEITGDSGKNRWNVEELASGVSFDYAAFESGHVAFRRGKTVYFLSEDGTEQIATGAACLVKGSPETESIYYLTENPVRRPLMDFIDDPYAEEDAEREEPLFTDYLIPITQEEALDEYDLEYLEYYDWDIEAYFSDYGMVDEETGLLMMYNINLDTYVAYEARTGNFFMLDDAAYSEAMEEYDASGAWDRELARELLQDEMVEVEAYTLCRRDRYGGTEMLAQHISADVRSDGGLLAYQDAVLTEPEKLFDIDEAATIYGADTLRYLAAKEWSSGNRIWHYRTDYGSEKSLDLGKDGRIGGVVSGRLYFFRKNGPDVGELFVLSDGHIRRIAEHVIIPGYHCIGSNEERIFTVDKSAYLGENRMLRMENGSLFLARKGRMIRIARVVDEFWC